MIKRSMAVAVAEENYARAAQLRDHPAMLMYHQIALLRRSGCLLEAIQLQDELDRQTEGWDFTEAEKGPQA
jgi:hypothetical protein